MQNISTHNTITRTTTTTQGNSDTYIQGLQSQGYRIDHFHEHNMFLAYKDGEVEYIITVY